MMFYMLIKNKTFIDRLAGEIILLVASVCVCAFVCWELSCLNRLTFDLDFCHEDLQG